ncbi:uncharacterized protein LOC118424703 [Branchiostoma floridae]|uniref:Uncharacterized protein LOC118424703 n=1 Tax=Branchiostoma floridae TaxID=7739 RepID=A0A9J7LUE6_BRAFL|nr:uncharacterized protein LOC118424703 [Branchiostoma floridae]
MTTAKVVVAACLGACVTLVLFLSVDWKNAVSVERWIDQQSQYSSEHEPRIAENSKTKTKPVARTPAKEAVSSGECSARTNFVFIKVHKAGSSTTTPIVAR